MSQYIQIAEEETTEPIELPVEEDGTLLLSTLSAQFPSASGLKFKPEKTGCFRGIRLVDGRLHPPEGIWDDRLYIVVFPKVNKRKADEEEHEYPRAKTKRLDKQKCSDLIVLGLPWKTTERDLIDYFKTFGDVHMVQLKKDTRTGQSKGYGFVRFADYETQMTVVQERHQIGDRFCDVRIPNSRHDSQQQNINRRVFVGRCTEDITADDLREFFMKFGDVKAVFVPKPFRAFAFVTFADPDVAQEVCGEDYIINNVSVHVSMNKDQTQGQGHHGAGGGRSDSGRVDREWSDNGRAGDGRSDSGRGWSDSGRAGGGRSDSGRAGGARSDSGRADRGWSDNGRSGGGRSDNGRRWSDNGRSDSGCSDSDLRCSDNGRAGGGRSDSGRADRGWSDNGRAGTGRSDSGRADREWSDNGRAGAGQSDSGRPDDGRGCSPL